MKKLISLLLVAALCVLPFPAHADDLCGRVQTDVASGNATDLGALITEQLGIPPAELSNVIGIQVVQSPITGNDCTVTWYFQQPDGTMAPGGPSPGCRGMLIVLGVELGILGITIYVVYQHYNPPPPDPHKPDWEMYMLPNGQIMEYMPGGPLMN